MKAFYRHLIISTLFLLLSFFLHAQDSIVEPQRWDERMINEADVWKNLLPYYYYANKTSYWPERKQALMKIINEFPESQWVDDALLLMTDEKAVIENNIDGAILELRNIQKNYPNESTIIVYWFDDFGCQIDRTWMMWVPSLIARDENNNVIRTYPFDSDNNIDERELEVITFFEHLEKYPERTKDVAQYIIALMLAQKGDAEGAIHELEALLANKNLREIKTIDYEASKSPHGYLIESVPSTNRSPLIRVELAACNGLLSLYSRHNEDEKLIELSDKIANEYSFDGWYWFINKKLGNIYAQHNQTIKAHEQYQLSIEGIKKRCKNNSVRLKVLYEQGLAFKHKDFISWEDQALRAHSTDIAAIERLLKNLNSSHLVVPGKRWVFQMASGEPPFEITRDMCYEISSDTTIENNIYQKLMVAHNCGQPQNMRGFIRETEEGKVYFLNHANPPGEEYLLYDFGMEAGDTVFTPQNERTSFLTLDSTGVNDNGQKLFYVSNSHNNNEIWIEGVGAKTGLLKEVMVGGSQMFTCCLVDGGMLYHNTDFENCYSEPLKVDAGNDTAFCAGYGQPDTVYLGNSVSIENGVPPYTYTWKTTWGSIPLTASDFLNDTTAANPYFVANQEFTAGFPIKFFIHVKDAENNIASDNITVFFSVCSCPEEYPVIDLIKGDSIILNAGSPYRYYRKYYWEPSRGLTNPDSMVTWCKPDSTTIYNLVKVDNFGCICSCPAYEIRVTDSTGVSSKKVALAETKCFFSGNGLNVERTNDLPYHLTVITLTGKVLHTGEYNERYLHLTGLGIKPQALYLVTVSDRKERKSFKLFNR